MLDEITTEALTSALETALDSARPAAATGAVADYIPALAEVDPGLFGAAICLADGREICAGDAARPFSIQSISKLFTLALALEWIDDPLWERVGREPSGMRFNSMIQLERENGIPRNPFINAGAITVVDALLQHHPMLSTRYRSVMRRLAENPAINFDPKVHASEIQHGDLNRAIAYFLKSKGNLREDPLGVTDVYFRFCATEMSCIDLARAARFLIGDPFGFCPLDIQCERHRPRLLAVMRMCGLYDQAGEFAYRVGLPAKSGVGGGIVAVKPGAYSICVWSPPLDEAGNSAGAIAALETIARDRRFG